MENPDPLGREHVPLPTAAPGARPERARASAATRPAAAYLAGQVVAVVAAAAAVGAGLWLGRGLNPETAIAAARVLVAPASAAASSVAAAPPMSPPAEVAAPAERLPASAAGAPILPGEAAFVPASPASRAPEVPSASVDRYAGAAAGAAKALPEPPQAESPAGVPDAVAIAALASRPTRLSAGATSSLFNRSVGGFVPWKDQKASRPMLISVGPARGAGAHGVIGHGSMGSAAPQAAAPAWRPLQNGLAQSRVPSRPASNTGAAASNPGTCADCADAFDRTGQAAYHRGNVQIGFMTYVGPCRDGYVYRMTNSSGFPLPPYVIGDDGEVWQTGVIQPGQTVDIRSQTPIHAVTLSGGGY